MQRAERWLGVARRQAMLSNASWALIQRSQLTATRKGLLRSLDGSEIPVWPSPRLGRQFQGVLLSPQQEPCHSKPAAAAQDALAVCEPSGEATALQGSPPGSQVPEGLVEPLKKDAAESGPQDSQPEMSFLTRPGGQTWQLLGQGSGACSQSPAQDLPLKGAASQTPVPVRQQPEQRASQPEAAPMPYMEAPVGGTDRQVAGSGVSGAERKERSSSGAVTVAGRATQALP